jgi:hypothetical protein
MSDLSALVAELESLYRALGAALGADPSGILTRSAVTRTADLWCARHSTRHRPDRWSDQGPEEERCRVGPDPGPDRALIAGAATVRPALPPTARAGSGARAVAGSRPPLDLGMLAAQREIVTAAAQLAADLRYRLGHARRESGLTALRLLPMLVDQLCEGGRPRFVDVGIGRLDQARTAARRELDIDLRPMQLDPCPSDRQPYAAAWDDGEWIPVAEWRDGVCREYDWAVSAAATAARRQRLGPLAGAVDVWRAARLYVRDPGAGIDSAAAAIRCPGCQRVWAGREGRAELFDLLHG